MPPRPSRVGSAKLPTPGQKSVQTVETAAALLDKGDKSDAAAAADKLGELAAASPANTDLKLAQAAALVSAGKLDDAIKGVEAILASGPTNIGALSMGAELARFKGDDKKRRSYLDRALATAPNDASVLSAWGAYSFDAKAWPKAEDFYKNLSQPIQKTQMPRSGLGGRSTARRSTPSRSPAQRGHRPRERLAAGLFGPKPRAISTGKI